ncbi:DUF5787 family protein [Haloplanus rubicundus]|uniref:Uncharacterized protein n=1 Tax=Haloplanus rubicundus TaxID=1547898 RepID=A0A345EA17_9EURY|nr:DUF5787 family protein [Haloplanus rubicundus]AXG09039.1 hypothetical protein DU484_03715 [Haloplanus rubicundus]
MTADRPEYAFELALCAHLERTREWVLGRQLGASVADPGARVVDVCAVVPGPEFDRRAAITSETIPPRAVECVGPGRAVDPVSAFDCAPARARRLADRAVEVGFFEAERQGSRRHVRATTRYPDWIGGLVGIENKPDLGRPGDLQRQLRRDTSLGLFDAVVLATESYVTGAHLNRIPDDVGVWRFSEASETPRGDGEELRSSGNRPQAGDGEAVGGGLTVVREPTPLDPTEPGVEPLTEGSLRTDVAVVDPEAKARKRRAIAERAYGKGWRPHEYPGCVSMCPTDDGRPYCTAFDRVVDPGHDCGASCPAFEAADPPAVDREALRDARTPWVADPAGVTRRQAGLDRFR